MKTVWVVVLSLFALVLGSCGGAVWKGTTGIFESIRIACAITTTADSSGLMTKAQVADAIDRLLKVTSQKSEKAEMDQFARELKAGCPNVAGLGAGSKK